MNQMKAETTFIVKNIQEIAYYMKGGITYDQLFLTSFSERQLFVEMLKEKIEAEVKMYSSTGFKR